MPLMLPVCIWHLFCKFSLFHKFQLKSFVVKRRGSKCVYVVLSRVSIPHGH